LCHHNVGCIYASPRLKNKSITKRLCFPFYYNFGRFLIKECVSIKEIISGSLFIIFLIISQNIIGQKGWEIGGGLGGSFYLGDLNTNYDFSKPGVAGTLVARYNYNERLSLKTSANYGYIQASDINSDNPFEKTRNLDFYSHFFDGALQLEFNFLPYKHGGLEDFFSPYVFFGASIFKFNPTTDMNGQKVELQPLGTEGQAIGEEYSLVQPALVFGVGVKFSINYDWSVNFEISGRKLFTDYIDDVSTVYPNQRTLRTLRGPDAITLSDRSIPDDNGIKIGSPGRQRGNSSDNDTVQFITISVLRYFGKLDCPTPSSSF
jgi:hypothetical protein